MDLVGEDYTLDNLVQYREDQEPFSLESPPQIQPLQRVPCPAALTATSLITPMALPRNVLGFVRFSLSLYRVSDLMDALVGSRETPQCSHAGAQVS